MGKTQTCQIDLSENCDICKISEIINQKREEGWTYLFAKKWPQTNGNVIMRLYFKKN